MKSPPDENCSWAFVVSVPRTSNTAVGAVVPMPTLPPLNSALYIVVLAKLPVVSTFKPVYTQALVPPVQAVRVGAAILMPLIVFVPEDEAPPVTLIVGCSVRPLVVGVREAVLALVCSVKAIFKPLVVTLPVMVVAVAKEALSKLPVSAAPWA